MLFGRFRHPNIVPLMGYHCGVDSAIVYEYICGGSLYQRLHQVSSYEHKLITMTLLQGFSFFTTEP